MRQDQELPAGTAGRCCRRATTTWVKPLGLDGAKEVDFIGDPGVGMSGTGQPTDRRHGNAQDSAGVSFFDHIGRESQTCRIPAFNSRSSVTINCYAWE